MKLLKPKKLLECITLCMITPLTIWVASLFTYYYLELGFSILISIIFLYKIIMFFIDL
jgi:hypothetical protein